MDSKEFLVRLSIKGYRFNDATLETEIQDAIEQKLDRLMHEEEIDDYDDLQVNAVKKVIQATWVIK